MTEYSRGQLDTLPRLLNLPPFYCETEDSLLVNGMLGKYKLWASKADRSVTPCLTGEVGGMPGAWENWITSWHTKNLGEFDTYIDVGANCGYFSGLAAYYGLSVISIEANPKYVDLLHLTIDENEFDNMGVIHAAVTDNNKSKIILDVPPELHGGASVRHSQTNLPGQGVEVDTITLDALSGPRGRGVLVKMDIEGAEEMAWAGAYDFNKRVSPTYIIEYTPRQYTEDFFESLNTYGEVTQVDFSGVEQPVTKAQANSSEDWITLVVRPRLV